MNFIGKKALVLSTDSMCADNMEVGMIVEITRDDFDFDLTVATDQAGSFGFIEGYEPCGDIPNYRILENNQ